MYMLTRACVIPDFVANGACGYVEDVNTADLGGEVVRGVVPYSCQVAHSHKT